MTRFTAASFFSLKCKGDYVWPATRVRDLLDSLYRGYPSGTILVWETDEDVEIKELAVRPTKSPTSSQRLLLLDGQQRITSLAAILSGQPVHVRRRQRPIEILFNLDHPEGPPADVLEVDENDLSADIDDGDDEEDERDIQAELRNRTFVVASRALQTNPIWVPVSSIFSKTDRDLLRRIGIKTDDDRWDKYSERLQRVRKIADYAYVMQVLENRLSYEEVTEIFVRVNSLGIKLRGSDLALAQISSRWKGFVRVCERFAREFGDDEGYLLDSGLLVRFLIVFATRQSRFKTVGRISKDTLEASWEDAKSALEFATSFAKSNAHIDNLALLSSPFLLIPIGVYAHLKKGRLTQQEDRSLLRWFYIAHMRAHYSMGSSETVLDADLAILFRTKSLSDLTKQLQTHVKQFGIDYADVENRGIRNPLFSMLYFVLRQNGAQDWLSGIKLSNKHVGKSHKLEFHHVFPKSLLKEAGYDRKEINEIANMAFVSGKGNRNILNKPPYRYFPEDVIPQRGKDALTSQLIPLEKELWKTDNFRDFLDYRRRAIVDEINQFMKKLE